MDPALWELLRAEAEADGDRMLEAIIRLARPGIEIPDIRIVSRFGTVATCRIRARDIVPVRARRDVVSLKAARGLSPGFAPTVGAAVPDALGRADFRPADVRRDPGFTLTGKGVVVASADWGVDVDSAAFRWPADAAAASGDRPAAGTRFLSFWDQRDLAAGPRPDPYGYGTVHDREQIDRALHDPRPYERLGYHPAIADRAGHGTHGTHVLDIAAGNGQAGGPAGIAPEADLIFVHLADRTTGGLANLGDSVRLLEAVDFISRTAGSQPCVINISAGRTCGPKDGTTLVERALDELLAATPGRFVVNSAGNYFGWRTHSCGRVAPGQSRSLTFVIDPADITLNELEIWYDGADEFAVRIDPPGYAGGRAVRLGERSDLLIDGEVIGRVYHRKHDPNNGDNHIVAYIDPVARAGNWTVTLEARQVNSGRFHAWIERDDTCRGCQPRFTPADSNPVTTIGTITTSRLPLIVGAYDGHDPARPVAPFSSSGPSRDLRPKPDLVAPGVDVLAARSASITDSHNPGLLVRKSGTSMATPHVTGAVALCLEAAGSQLGANAIRSLVLGSCDPVPDTESQRRLGHGYLNIPRLVADVRQALAAPASALSTKEPIMDTEDASVLLTTAPATAYREYVYRPRGQLARWITDRYNVVARPGQRVDRALQNGDLLIEIQLGRMGGGHCITLDEPELDAIGSRSRLIQGQLILRPLQRVEMSEPLPVEPTSEAEDTDLSRLTGQGLSENQITDAPLYARYPQQSDAKLPAGTCAPPEWQLAAGGAADGGVASAEDSDSSPWFAEDDMLPSVSADRLMSSPAAETLEVRSPGPGERSAFDRRQDLIDRLNAQSPAIQYHLDSRVIRYQVKDEAGLTNFDREMRRLIDFASVIPMRLIDRTGYIGGSPLSFDSFQEAYVDLDDLLASSDLAFQLLMIHFLTERSQVKNYAQRIGTDLSGLYPQAHRAGREAEAQHLRSVIGDGTIEYAYDEPRPGGAYVIGFRSRAERYWVFRVNSNQAQTGVRGSTVFVQMPDRRRLTVEQLQARRVGTTPPAPPATTDAADEDISNQYGNVVVSTGGFGTALRRFAKNWSVHDDVLLLLKQSPMYMSIVATLDAKYVDGEPIGSTLPLSPDGVVTKGPNIGRRLIYFQLSSNGSYFMPYEDPDNVLAGDIIWLETPPNTADPKSPENATLATIGRWIERIAHESVHAARRMLGKRRPGNTAAERIHAAVDDEIETRKTERKIVDELRRRSRTFAMYQPTTGSFEGWAVERDFFPGEQRRTYLENFVLGELRASARTELTDEQAKQYEGIVNKISVESPPYTSFLTLTPQFVHPRRGRMPIFSLRYPNILLALRVIDARWQSIKDLKQRDVLHDTSVENMRQEHAKAFFDNLVNYTKRP